MLRAPSPLVREGWGGGWLRMHVNLIDPPPCPSPASGGGNRVARQRLKTHINRRDDSEDYRTPSHRLTVTVSPISNAIKSSPITSGPS